MEIVPFITSFKRSKVARPNYVESLLLESFRIMGFKHGYIVKGISLLRSVGRHLGESVIIHREVHCADIDMKCL